MAAQNSAPVQRGRPRGKPFGKNDPRRNNGGVPKEVRDLRLALLDDGEAVHKALMKLVRKGNTHAVLYAHQQLIGKPAQTLKLTGKVDTGRDLSGLTDEELEQLERIYAGAAQRAAEPGGGSQGASPAQPQ